MVAPTTAARLVREVEHVISRTPWHMITEVKYDIGRGLILIQAKMPNLAKPSEQAEIQGFLTAESIELAKPFLVERMVKATLEQISSVLLHNFLTIHIRGQKMDPRTY